MSKIAHIQQSFDAGVLSPRLAARSDLAKYHSGCSVLENFLPTVQGPLVRRGGTQFVTRVSGGDDPHWLLPFAASERTGYMLEFAPHTIRVYTGRGVLLGDDGNPVAISTPFAASDLTTPQGTFAIRATQSADVMYLFCRGHAPRKLKRMSANSFVLDTVAFAGGPFADVNPDDNVTVSASAAAGAVTLTASHGIFVTGDAGSLFLMQSSNLAHVRPWAVYQRVNVGDKRRVGGRVYVCTAHGGSNDEGGPVTGNQTPVHTEGRAWDGDGLDTPNDSRGLIGAQWEFLHAGDGWVKIDSVASPTHASATVVSRLPDDVLATPTARWAHSLFSDAAGWPELGAFWRNRLALLRDGHLALSVAGDFENFSDKIDGEIRSDSAITQQLAQRSVNRMAWMVDADELLLGSNGDEWVIGPIQPTQPLGPENIRAERVTAWGSRAIAPAQTGGKLLFVSSSGSVLRDFEYSFDSDNYASHDLTRLADHVLTGGTISMAWQKEPDNILWLARADGVLCACTLHQDPGVSDVYAWHLHRLAGGQVTSVATLPAPDGASSDLWLMVRRQIDGQSVHCVEILRRPLADDQPQAQSFYVDSGLTYDGPPVSQLSGLSHLEGQSVAILADGAVHPPRVVQQGRLALDWPASIIHVGLPAPCAVATMGLDAGSNNGTAQGKTKRLTNVKVRVDRTLGGMMGPDRHHLETLNFRRAQDPMGAAPALFTGERTLAWPGDYETDARIWYVNDQPLPVTLLAFMPMLAVQDDR